MLSPYTIRFNHRHKVFGHVFGGRYKALLVDGSGDGYLRTVCDYVHLNPARAGLLGAEDRLLAYPWSSLGWYVAAVEHRPKWVRVDRLPGEHGIGADTAAGRKKFEQRMEGKLGEHHAGERRRESAEARAERIIAEELGKLALATRLRRETTLTTGWIVARLQMGTRKSAVAKLHRWGKRDRDGDAR